MYAIRSYYVSDTQLNLNSVQSFIGMDATVARLKFHNGM